MSRYLLNHLRGVVSLLMHTANTVFWATPLLITAAFKLGIPIESFRNVCDRLLNRFAGNWVGVNNWTQQLLYRISWHETGLDTLQPRQWYLVVANHQSWVDILVLQKVFHKKIPFLKFFLKKELIWFPVLGLAWWALDFPFMKRYSKSFIKKHPHLAGSDLEITKKACAKFKTTPVSIMNFAEGTRFTGEKHTAQRSPYQNLLRPKAGGIAFTLGTMGQYLNSFLDVTIVYPEGGGNFWDYLCGNIRDIRVRVRELPITSEMLGDYYGDRQFRKDFQKWLNHLWEQKDVCFEALLSSSPCHVYPDPSPESRFLEPLPVSDSVVDSEK